MKYRVVAITKSGVHDGLQRNEIQSIGPRLSAIKEMTFFGRSERVMVNVDDCITIVEVMLKYVRVEVRRRETSGERQRDQRDARAKISGKDKGIFQLSPGQLALWGLKSHAHLMITRGSLTTFAIGATAKVCTVRPGWGRMFSSILMITEHDLS